MAGFRTAWQDTIAVLDLHSGIDLRRLLPQLLAGLILAVYLYVPAHELLHAAGCLAVGGRVTAIEIAPLFGGRLLARLFPVISAETAYAGRLGGFDVGGSSLRLLATDLAPYLLTVLAGVPLVRRLQRRPAAWLVAPALLLALAPFLSLPGDYYEMGSVLVTTVLARFGPDWRALRSDDLVRLCASVWEAPEAFGLATRAHAVAAAGVISASFALGAALASATYLLGSLLAGRARRPGDDARSA